MIFYYIMRDVVRGSDCSYRPGRTYIDEVYRYPDEARRRAEQCNRHCGVAGVCYVVLPHSDTKPLPMDYFEPKQPVRLERVLV